MNKRGHIKSCNSSLTQSSWELEKSSLDGLKSYLRADFPAQPTNLAQDTRIANALKKFASCVEGAESSEKFKSKKPFKSFCYFWLLPKVESPLTLWTLIPQISARCTQDQIANTRRANIK